MKPTRSARLLALVSLVPIGLLALARVARAQEVQLDEAAPRIEDPRLADPQSVVSVVFEGIVLGPDGAPAPGAVVVSSAGGKAVTDQDGAYRLEVEAPLEAGSAQVTAVAAAAGGGSLTASTSVGLLASRLARVGPLVLASSTTCQPSWLPTFGGAAPDAEALTVFDDGSGPALYAGGSFIAAGGVAANNIARWDGSSWSALGAGLTGSSSVVRALTVFDDGGGPALYAGGFFTTAGGIAASNIAKWDGSSWSALGSGASNWVIALAAFDDGSGPALYAGGLFSTAGGVAANRIAKWDGSSWSALGSGANDTVFALAAFDDGGGPALYAGGNFSTAGGVAANWIAKWDGSSWSALGSGANATVAALAAFDDGGGPALYAGGTFTTAGGVAANRIAKWDGSSWSALGSGANGTVYAFAAFDDGGGPALYAGGQFTDAGGVIVNHVARWNGSSWSALGTGMGGPVSSTVSALAVFDDGSGPALHTEGVKWDGSAWSPLERAMNSAVVALTVFDDGSGPALYAGGYFTTAGGEANRIARWNGSSWSALGSGMSVGWVQALTVHDDGSGLALYVGGYFTSAGGGAANGIARWDGTSWSALGSGMMSSSVDALAVFDDGSGPALYAGGAFTVAGGVPATYVARWDGSSWSAVGGGVTRVVNALMVFDDGTGPALYAGGEFRNTGSGPAERIAKWDGSSWSALGSGMSGSGSSSRVLALTVHDDGSGSALYAGGEFTTAGGVAAKRIARWDGSSWSALGGGMSGGWVQALTVHDDGSGLALYAGGSFTTAGGVAANRIARWDGTSWSALGSGMDNLVWAMTVFDDGSGPALFAGGNFLGASDSGDSFLAEWGCDTTPPVLSCPEFVFAGDHGSPGEVVTFEVTATDVHDTSPTVVCVPPSGSVFPRGTTLVHCTATDDAGNVSTCWFPVIVQPKVHRPAKDPRGE